MVACINRSRNQENSISRVNITFHRLPNASDIRKLTLQLAGKNCLANPNKNLKICSDHYCQSDFNVSPRNRRRLLENAIPSLNLPVTPFSQRSQNFLNVQKSGLRKQIVDLTRATNQQEVKLEKLKCLKRKAVENWQAKYIRAKLKWNRKESLYLTIITKLRTKNSQKLTEINLRYRTRMRTMLTPVQQTVLLENKTRTWWTTTEISKAGGLTIPSFQWLTLFRNFEQMFCKLHKQVNHYWPLNRSCFVMAHLTRLISERYPDVEEELINYYVNYVKNSYKNSACEQRNL